MTPRTPLARSLIEARARTDTLFGLVKPDAFYERPIPERHRIIFYLGHLDAFDWNQIGQWALGMKPLHASFEQMFAFGIDPPVGQLPDDKATDWPTLDEVRGYTQQVRQTLDDVLDRAPEQILYVAVEHRLMHAETFAYILHRATPDRKLALHTRLHLVGPVPNHAMIDIPEGSVTLGRPRHDGFGWDNEYDAHAFSVPAFAISKYKVTNGEYLKFVCGGAGWGFTLDEPSQGRIAVRLTLGSGRPWCAEAPAKASGHPPSTAANDRAGRFVAQPGTPAPLACPAVP